MNWLDDLLKEHPDLAAAKEKLALWQDKYNALEAENENLKKEKRELKETIPKLENLVAQHVKIDPFIEDHGVLWKRGADGSIDKIAYCPKCRLVMTPFPSGNPECFICTQCKLRAPFNSEKSDSIAKNIKR